MPFHGLRVLSLESRRAEEMATLVRKQGGEPIVAPSMREVPLEHNERALDFARQLIDNHFDGILFLTGVGTRLLWKVMLTGFPEPDLRTALQKATLIVRGPKPSAVLRELGITPDVFVPEPNTWREVLVTMSDRPERRLAVQEYGQSNRDLIDGLIAQNRDVVPVPIYAWDMPEDTGPLREAARSLSAGGIDVVLFTTSMQVVNLMRIAEEDGIGAQVKKGLATAFIGSIGPTTSETLEDYGLKASFEPSHPKMGLLVNEAAALITLPEASES